MHIFFPADILFPINFSILILDIIRFEFF